MINHETDQWFRRFYLTAKGLFNKSLKVLILIWVSVFLHLDSHAQSELEKSMALGKEIYNNECITCHMDNGEGIVGAFPPLAQSDYFKDDVSKAVNAILNGLEGELVVNNNTYYGVMDPVELSDHEMADLLNYIQNSWGGKSKMLKVKDITKLKKSIVNSQ